MDKLSNKETINLLDLSDDESDISDLFITPKKKKVKRRHRSNGLLKSRQLRSTSCKISRMRAASFWVAAILVSIWLATLSWLAVVLYGELRRMDVSVKSVIAGSEGVPDALQTCHTLDKNFKANITRINDEIRKLNTSLNTFSTQISKFQQELQQLQVSVKSAPELTSVPATVKDLQNNIGQLELEFNDLQAGFKTLKDTAQRSQEEQKNIFNKVESTLQGLQNLTQQPQKVPTNETLLETKKLRDTITELSKNITHINQTLAMNILWAQEDIIKDRKTLASLLDKATNASTLIQTLQQEYVKRKDQEVLQHAVESLSDRVDKISSSVIHQQTLQNLEQMYNTSQSSSGTLMSSSADFKNNGPNEPLFQNKPKSTEITAQSTYRTSVPPSASSLTSAN
ncbi:uncharacterized protein LOC131667755 isoform X2 [Phymastichus coffea]|uniref:uncharacterized protein LOC131667755 isoform X2 n=2 Tax=Phymastichus coffea TaxID=108790 RepID=UPI00273AB5A5|nr:uncharacterized protein LOC131667755 isoform X2 [Phymastichus coffea]